MTTNTETDRVTKDAARLLANGIHDPRMKAAGDALEEFRHEFWAALVTRWARERIKDDPPEVSR